MAIRDKIISGSNGINFTKETDSSADWPSISNSTYFRDVADGLIHYKNSAGTVLEIFSAGGASIPQANKIYVDSINGTDATGRGNINNPYLTPEYALADITNTGTVTATTSTSSNTLTAVSSTANIVVGQFITGAGIPYNSVVVSKTVSTIVLSQVCTANATITATWWNMYELILNGNFTWVSNWLKQGFIFDFGEANIVYAGDVFLTTASQVVPFIMKGGNWNGISASSRIFRNTLGYSSVADFTFKPLSNITIGTGYCIDFAQNGIYKYKNVDIECQRFICLFGYVANLEGDGVANVSGYYYGLLGGFVIRYGYFNLYGVLETPSAVSAINSTGGACVVNISATVRGGLTAINTGAINGDVNGTTFTFTGGKVIVNGNLTGSTGSSNSGFLTVNGVSQCDFTSSGDINGSQVILRQHMGAFTASGNSVNTIAGTSTSGISLTTITLTGTCTVDILDSKFMVNNSSNLNVGAGCTVNNRGYYRGNLSNCAGTINNYGQMLLRYNISVSGLLMNNNFISITNFGTESPAGSPTIILSGSGVYQQNGGKLIIIDSNSKSGAIRKTSNGSKIQLTNQAYIKVANGLAPIQILSNVGTAQDVEIYSVIDNCAVGFRISNTFSDTTYGTAYAPNILVGGTMLEATTYLL